MKNKPKAKTPLERFNKHVSKLKRFGVRRIYFKASLSQEGLIQELIHLTNSNSREELIHDLLEQKGAEFGLTLKDITKRIKDGSLVVEKPKRKKIQQ